MTAKYLRQPYTPFFSSGPASTSSTRTKPTHLDEEKSRKPDWLILLISALVLLTLLIAWVVNTPNLLH